MIICNFKYSPASRVLMLRLHRTLATKAAVLEKRTRAPPLPQAQALSDSSEKNPTPPTTLQAGDKSQVGTRKLDPLDTSFNDTATSYKSKSLQQLLRNYFVLGLCSNGLLVRNNEKIMKITRSLLGKTAFKLLMRGTFYGQFVAGQDEREIEPVIKHLASFGVKTILDYSAEEDINEEEVREEELTLKPGSQEQVGELDYLSHLENSSPMRRYQQSADFADRRKYEPVARTYFYHGESQCDKNLAIFMRAIEAVTNATGNTGFAAIKLTALGRPRLLMKLSKIIDYMERVDHGKAKTAHETLPELLKSFESLSQSDIGPLTEDEHEMLANMINRVERLGKYTSQVRARCMIDAEQTYMQPAINMIAMHLMRKFNHHEAIIFNTYQCYLKSAYAKVVEDLALAGQEGFFFGAKLVRGAYMDQERARAKKLGYEDPINESFEASTEMYEKTLAYLMSEIELAASKQAGRRPISIMVASHNEATVRYALEQMQKRNIKPEHKVICFGQLYGMCDHVSFALGQSGYSVYKYTPYGPIEEVLPYLGRRAIENHGFLSKLQRERSLIASEILRRLITLRWFYRPVGNYSPI